MTKILCSLALHEKDVHRVMLNVVPRILDEQHVHTVLLHVHTTTNTSFQQLQSQYSTNSVQLVECCSADVQCVCCRAPCGEIENVVLTMRWLKRNASYDCVVFVDNRHKMPRGRIAMMLRGWMDHPEACISTRGIVVGTMVGPNFMHMIQPCTEENQQVDIVEYPMLIGCNVLGTRWRDFCSYHWLSDEAMEQRAKRLPSIWFSAVLDQLHIPRYVGRRNVDEDDDCNTDTGGWWSGGRFTMYSCANDVIPLLHYLHIRLGLFQVQSSVCVSRIGYHLIGLWLLSQLLKVVVIFFIFKFLSKQIDTK